MSQPDQQFNFDDLTNVSSHQVIKAPTRRRGGCCLASVIVLLAVVVAAALIAVTAGSALSGLLPNFGGLIATVSSAMQPPESRPITGDPSRFDPLAALAEAKAFAGDGARLATITASYVRSDGTMDLNATYTPAPYTEYTFLREIPRPTDAPPIGVAGSTAGQWYEPITIEAFKPGQQRRVTTVSGGVSTSFTYVNQGLLKQVEDPTTTPFDEIVPEPSCAFTTLWKSAVREGAPEDAVAIIDYDAEGYTFNIVGTLVLRFDHDCNLRE